MWNGFKSLIFVIPDSGPTRLILRKSLDPYCEKIVIGVQHYRSTISLCTEFFDSKRFPCDRVAYALSPVIEGGGKSGLDNQIIGRWSWLHHTLAMHFVCILMLYVEYREYRHELHWVFSGPLKWKWFTGVFASWTVMQSPSKISHWRKIWDKFGCHESTEIWYI